MAMVRRLVESVVLVVVVLALTSCTHHSQAPRTSTTVPSVQNRTPVEAQHLLRHEGLVLVGFRETKDPAIPKGMVVSSDPAPGKRVAAGTSVILIVSTGAPSKPVRRTVPQQDIRKTQERATALITPALTSVRTTPMTSVRENRPAVRRSAPDQARERPIRVRSDRRRPAGHTTPVAARAVEPRTEAAVRVARAHPRFTCAKCGMRFDTQTELAAHMEMHVFRCKICGAGFSTVSDLMRHAREQHFRAQFRCPECGVTFYTDTGLRTHKAKHPDSR